MEESNSVPAERRVAVVTGGNRGIGLEICKQLSSNGITVVLTARDEKRGAEAVDALRGFGLSDTVFHQLDVTDPSGAASLADFIKDKFGKLDILVNNAGILGAMFDFGDTTAFIKVVEDKSANETLEWLMQHTIETYENAEECLRINYHGTKNVIQALLPLLQSSPDGRIVNISSILGQLSVRMRYALTSSVCSAAQWLTHELFNYQSTTFFSGEELKQELNDVDNLSDERINELSELFLKDFKDDVLESRGWPAKGGFLAYKASKALVHAYTRVLARTHASSLRINCVYPGYVKTDMTFDTGELTLEEGAGGPVAVALLPEGGPTGVFFNRTEIASFV